MHPIATKTAIDGELTLLFVSALMTDVLMKEFL